MRRSTLAHLAAGFGMVSCLPLENDDSIHRSSLQPRNPWQPAVGSSWQIILSQTLELDAQNPTVTPDVDIFDIDMFSHQKTTTIASLHKLNKKIICYFSAGSYEPGRPDSLSLIPSVRGRELDGWPGEFWLDIRSPLVRSVMAARILVAAQMGCDAIDPDNLDGYQNANGLQLTAQNSIDFVKFLAAEAAKYNMGIGLKNALDIIPSVLPYVQFAVNEQCAQYDECTDVQPFITSGKPVFHIEYSGGHKSRRSIERREAQPASISQSKFSTRLGCYLDTDDTRVFRADFDDDDDMTPRMCQQYCSDYPYFGLERGNQCYCSTTMTSSPRQSDTDCNSPCDGDNGQTCGGRKRIEIYHITSPSASLPTTSTSAHRQTSVTISTTTTPRRVPTSINTSSPLTTTTKPTTRTTSTAGRSTSTQRASTQQMSERLPTASSPAVVSNNSSGSSCSSYKNINGFSTVIKRLTLDGWVQYCNGQIASTVTQ